jgi:hypothetical protein
MNRNLGMNHFLWETKMHYSFTNYFSYRRKAQRRQEPLRRVCDVRQKRNRSFRYRNPHHHHHPRRHTIQIRLSERESSAAKILDNELYTIDQEAEDRKQARPSGGGLARLLKGAHLLHDLYQMADFDA